MIMGRDNHMEVLILGMGWTSTFLVPLLHEEGVRCAKTTTTGRDGTIKFKFDPESDDTEQFKQLPDAQTILITFPVKGAGASKHLLKLYGETHPSADPRWIQLGSTGIFQIPGQNLWVTRHSKYDRENARAIAEDELLEMGGCVLNLSGLWGGSRDPREWVKRVATTKDQLRDKASLHMVHGQDVARAIYALHKNYTPKERWMLTDLFVYDWWALILGWGDKGADGRDKDAEGPHIEWVRELMLEEGVRALPRSMEQLGRAYDSREFWEKMGMSPVRARI